MELKIEYLPIKVLKPYEKNTRKHQKKDVDNIARSIEKYDLGTIYQATNWIYVGKTITSDTQYFYKDKWTHERTINAQKNKEQLKATLPKRENSNKFKYVFLL